MLNIKYHWAVLVPAGRSVYLLCAHEVGAKVAGALYLTADGARRGMSKINVEDNDADNSDLWLRFFPTQIRTWHT